MGAFESGPKGERGGKKMCGVIKDNKSGQNSGETAALLLRHLEIFWD